MQGKICHHVRPRDAVAEEEGEMAVTMGLKNKKSLSLTFFTL